MDDLEINPLHRALLGQFMTDFEMARESSCVIAIPLSETLEELPIDQYLARHHILVPSKLLKSRYTPMQNDYLEEVELDDDRLVCHRVKSNRSPSDELPDLIVNIVSQVTGYNQKHKQYKVLLIDRPLIDPNYQPPLKGFLTSRLGPLGRYSGTVCRRRLRPTKPLTDQLRCIDFLESISQQITTDLESEVRLIQTKYRIYPRYMDDAARRIKQLAEHYVIRYQVQAEIDFEIVQEPARRDICLAVENYIIYLLHDKLMSSIQNYYARKDRRLLENFQEIYNTKLTITQLGAQSAFEDFKLPDDLALELVKLPSLQCPLAIVSCLIRSIDLINEGLRQSVKLRVLFGDLPVEIGDSSSVSICSDDIIATLVYSLAQVRLANLYSLSMFLDIFGWSSSLRDKAAFSTATFQLVIQHVLNYYGDSGLSSAESEIDVNNKADGRSPPPIRSPNCPPTQSSLCSGDPESLSPGNESSIGSISPNDDDDES